jgi:heavy metal translocating P-type ATPase
VLRDEGPVYFEVGCVVLVLVTLGRWLEATGRARATQALENLERLLPEQVRVLAAAGEIEKRRGDVQVGERLRVRAGERVPCDGVVLGHAAAVDEQLLTGESGGRVKEPGERVHAGTLNLDSDLILEVCSEPEAGALSRIVRLIRQARQQQGQYEQLADRVTAWLLPLVTIIALGAAAWHGYRLGIDHGLLAGLAVLLIACPCALGIATPLALWVAQGEAAAHHVLFQSNEALERLARVDHLCFDKTGTLTTGQCTVSAIHCDDDAARRRTLALTAASNHTHAQALAAALRQGGTVLEEVATHLQTLPGRGLVADWQPDGERVLLGSLRLMRENTQLVPQGLAGAVAAAFAGGQPLVCIGWGGFVRGVFVLQEELRPEAKAALAQLQELGIEVSVLTGDHGQRGAVLARELGVSVAAELLPEDKVAKLQELRRAGRIVAMVGDGINDGPALAASDVGIALGCGADVARDSAGVCLLNNDLARLPWAIALARRAVWVVRENLFWAFAYNVAGIALAATGLLNPVLAALAMLLSSVLVLANSLRLRSATPTPVIESDACSIVS